MRVGPLQGLIALFIVVTTISSVRADDADAKKELQAQYRKYITAYRKKDMKAIMALYSPGYMAKDVNGKTVTRQQEELQLKQDLTNLKTFNKAEVTIETLTVKGPEATATIQATADVISVDSQGKMGAKGKSHHMVSSWRQTDTWTKEAGGWKYTRCTSLPGAKITVDGKPLSQKK